MNDAHSIAIVECAPRRLASVRRQASLTTLGAIAAAAPLWERAFTKGIEHGRPVMVLHEAAGEAFFTPPGVPVDIGVEIDAPVRDPVMSTTLSPGGRAAMGRHLGDEASIGDTHRRIRAWCAANGEQLTGQVVLVHYCDIDRTRRVTEINYLLA